MKKLNYLFTIAFMVAALASCNLNDKTDLTGIKGISNERIDVQPCNTWIGETAWGCGTEFLSRGNWAKYINYQYYINHPFYKDRVPPNFSKDLLAGQNMIAGKVNFAAVDGMVQITITLFEGWRFQDVPENVKAQNYSTAPIGIKVAPGKFVYKDDAKPLEDTFIFKMPVDNFYAVHVDVEWYKACGE